MARGGSDQAMEEVLKMPLKRFELPLHKFTEVAIPLHLDLLNKHRTNIEKFQALKEWDKVHREQVNASRTVQQLKAYIWEMDRLRQKVRDEDLPLFDKRISQIRKDALTSVETFIDEHHIVTDPSQLLQSPIKEKRSPDEKVVPLEPDSIPLLQLEQQKPTVFQEQKVLSEAEAEAEVAATEANIVAVPKHTPAAQSWLILRQDLLDLNQMIQAFSNTVLHHQPLVERTKQNLADAVANVQEGTNKLKQAAKLKTALYPVAGALIGCMAGPVGVIAGIKIGIAAAVGGSLIGYQGGKYIQRKKELQLQAIEMEAMTAENRSNSLPDLRENSIDDISESLSKATCTFRDDS